MSESFAPLRIGGIVLCGGKSSRMGSPKAWLPVGEEVFLQRIVRVLSEVVSPVVVVAAAGQELPSLPSEVRIVRDEFEALGPVGGLATGMASLEGQVDAAYTSACDVPLLKAEVVRRLCVTLGDADVAVPVGDGFHHPLGAVYRLTLASKARQMVAARQLRAIKLWEGAQVRELPIESLKDIDPELDSFRNTNTPADYQRICEQLARLD